MTEYNLFPRSQEGDPSDARQGRFLRLQEAAEQKHRSTGPFIVKVWEVPALSSAGKVLSSEISASRSKAEVCEAREHDRAGPSRIAQLLRLPGILPTAHETASGLGPALYHSFSVRRWWGGPESKLRNIWVCFSSDYSEEINETKPVLSRFRSWCWDALAIS